MWKTTMSSVSIDTMPMNMNYYSMTLVVKTNAVVPTKDRGRHQRRESPTLNNQQKIFDLIRATGNESGTKSRRDWTRGEARADTSRRISRDWNQIHLYHSLIKCYLTNASSHSTPLALPAKYQETSSAFVYWSICVWIVELGLSKAHYGGFSKSCNNSYFKTWRHPPPFIWCENDDEWSDWCHADDELLLHDTDRHLRSEDVPLAAPQILGNVYGLNGPSVLPWRMMRLLSSAPSSKSRVTCTTLQCDLNLKIKQCRKTYPHLQMQTETSTAASPTKERLSTVLMKKQMPAMMGCQHLNLNLKSKQCGLK